MHVRPYTKEIYMNFLLRVFWSFWSLFFAFLATDGVLLAADYQFLQTDRYEDIQKAYERLAAEVGGKKVLVVIDLDNTTLKTNTDFASEHWMLWQTELLKAGHQTVPLVAGTFSDIIAAQNLALKIAPMELVSPEIAATLQSFQSQGTAVIAITSRGIELREASVRELARHGIRLATKDELKLSVPNGEFFPYDVKAPETSGLTARDIDDFALHSPKQTLFDDGVYLTEGQHKGIMLRTLLAKAQRTFSAIIFIDDRMKHQDAMKKAYESIDVKLLGAHYTNTAAAIEAFQSSPKDEVSAQWCAFSTGLARSVFKDVMPRRFYLCP